MTAIHAVNPDPAAPPDKPAVMLKRIGTTTYHVSVHLSATSKETMGDKITRMIRNETVVK
jgi:hypothetical protein